MKLIKCSNQNHTKPMYYIFLGYTYAFTLW